MDISDRPVTVVTATGVETLAARKALAPTVRVVQAGIALRATRARIAGIAISCGLAGGLRDDVPTGTVLIPRVVHRTDGVEIVCEESLVESLAAAARALGYAPVDAPLLSSAALVREGERKTWAERGYAGADMESGFIDCEALACVRVVLDTPQREISAAWQRPGSVLVSPRAWIDVPFLAREGPRCAAIAARVIAAALRDGLRSTPIP